MEYFKATGQNSSVGQANEHLMPSNISNQYRIDQFRRCESFLESKQLVLFIKYLPAFKESEDSLPCAQKHLLFIPSSSVLTTVLKTHVLAICPFTIGDLPTS